MSQSQSKNQEQDISALINIDAAALEGFASGLLLAAGYTAHEAEATARSLVLSNLYGHDSHGVIRVHEYISALNHGEVASGVDLEVVRDHPASCVVDGKAGLGQVQMPRFLDILMDKAETCGCASGAMRYSGHVGRLGEWTELLAEKGFGGFVIVNDNGALECVAPPGAKQPTTSTNPIAFGVPLDDGDVFSLDMSTSAVAIGKMRLKYISGESCAEGLIQDAEGRDSTSPAVMFEEPKGALKPFGGIQDYKGFGLSMMTDLLVAGLSGGFAPPAPEGEDLLNNVVVMVWHADSYAGLTHMRAQAEKYTAYVRQAAPIDPARPVRVAGDRSKAEKAARLKNGIPVSVGTIQKLGIRARTLSVRPPEVFQDIIMALDIQEK